MHFSLFLGFTLSSTLASAHSGSSLRNVPILGSDNESLSVPKAPFGPRRLDRHADQDLSKNTSALKAGDQCWSRWDAWATSSLDCSKTATTLFPGSTLASLVYTSTIFETFKLCDGHPRARVTGTDRTSFTTLVLSSGEPSTVQTVIIPPSGIPASTVTGTGPTVESILSSGCVTSIPTPTCSIADQICTSLFSVWTAGNFSRVRPPCTQSVPKNPCDACELFVPSVQLIYFPVSMTGNFCGDYRTVTPSASPTGPVTVEVSGTTFTSGFAYLSYAGITAGGIAGLCGTTKGPGLLALPSSDVFSFRGADPALAEVGDVHYAFNFADLAPNPVPWAAWISQATCAEAQNQPQCQTITQAAYRPGIVYPRQFWSLEPEWSKCGSGAFGIVDPPTALPAVHQVALPTDPARSSGSAGSTTMSAAPKNSVSANLPDATSGSGARSTSVAGVVTGSATPTSTTENLPVNSVLQSDLVNGADPRIALTLGSLTYTAYSGGVLAAPESTLVLPKNATVTIDDQTVGFESKGVLIGTSMHTFSPQKEHTVSSITSLPPIVGPNGTSGESASGHSARTSASPTMSSPGESSKAWRVVHSIPLTVLAIGVAGVVALL